MAHKNAQELLREVKELLKEIEVYSSQRDAMFADLASLDKDYHSGRYPYLGYEAKKKAILRSRPREEWKDYYKAYILSLLKKAEFIVSQVLAIVHDDSSFNSLKFKVKSEAGSFVAQHVSRPEERFRAAAAPAAALRATGRLQAEARLPAPAPNLQAQKHVQVFNIDNELSRLRQLLAAGHIATQLEELKASEGVGPEGVRKKISLVIPKFGDLVREIEEAERMPSLKHVSQPQPKPMPALQVQPQVKRKIMGAYQPSKSKTASAEPMRSGGFAASVRQLPAIGLILKPLVAAAKLIIDVPLTAARSLRGAARRIGAAAQKRHATQKPSVAPGAKKQPVFANLPSPLALFKSLAGKQQVKASQAQLAPAIAGQKQGIFLALSQLFDRNKAKRGIFVEEIVAMEKQVKVAEPSLWKGKKEADELAFGWFSARGLLREITEKFRSKQESILAEQTAIPVHVKKLKEMRTKLYEEERLSGFDTTLLAQEARRVKKILEVERPEVYQGSSVGLIANLTVRKLSLYLVDQFPEFFGFLYNALRSANVKVLSNTYVNIMILSTLFVVALSCVVLVVIFFILAYPVYQIILRSMILSIIAGFACATIFYAYPFMKIKDRRRNITTNLPFAANHMAAVATSGVPPASMFELIAASKEYGEIGVEVKKIVDFITIFGYDLLTAIKTVAATTPSPNFKEFLEGMVSTIETGGDLDRYLRQEADQAALTYNLERQRYNETVSTYSDIYTGLLIAAPLFFVAAMSLVNLLGGSVGGIGVDVIMAVGAYLIIPLLNIGFLAFLQFTQPEA